VEQTMVERTQRLEIGDGVVSTQRNGDDVMQINPAPFCATLAHSIHMSTLPPVTKINLVLDLGSNRNPPAFRP
jgi:hypothetical protein